MGFLVGFNLYVLKFKEIEVLVCDGVVEIDIVIICEYVFIGNWEVFYCEMCDFCQVCGDVYVKVIFVIGELKILCNVVKVLMVCMMVGVDFIKIFIGKESVNVILLVLLVMLCMICQYQEMIGMKVGYKFVGGVVMVKDVFEYQVLMKEELGDDWL